MRGEAADEERARTGACPTLCHVPSAAKGYLELVQLILESAVAHEGPARAKHLCLDHVNAKRQSALMVSCKHGCVGQCGVSYH